MLPVTCCLLLVGWSTLFDERKSEGQGKDGRGEVEEVEEVDEVEFEVEVVAEVR